MNASEIPLYRLQHQQLVNPTFTSPVEVIAWLGAVQAQDFAGAKWAVAQRTTGMTESALDQAFAAGEILRTHLLRPTWHFVTPADLRWILALTAPYVQAQSAYQYRQLELDQAIFTRSNHALEGALSGGQQLTRAELGTVLERAGIQAVSTRLSYLLMRAELEGVVCSGARRGKQFTYALLEERLPPVPPLDREAALAELTRRYFASRGPATLQDFRWWSGLPAAEAEAGLALAASQLQQEMIAEKTYWFTGPAPAADLGVPSALLLPNYDEYVVGYTDRSAIFDTRHTSKLGSRDSILFHHLLVSEGQVVGTWRRTLQKAAVLVSFNPFAPLSKAESQAFTAAAARYGAFLGLPLMLE
jgi:hypothetical protein